MRSVALLRFSNSRWTLRRFSVLKLPGKDEACKSHGVPLFTVLYQTLFAKKSEIQVMHLFHKLLQ